MSGNSFASVGLSLDSSDAFSYLKSVWPDGADIPGVGQGAYWVPSINTLWVDLGNQQSLMLLIFASDATQTDYRSIAVEIAKKAVGRM